MWLWRGSHHRHPCHCPYGNTSNDMTSMSYPLSILRGQQSVGHITHENYSFSILNYILVAHVIIL